MSGKKDFGKKYVITCDVPGCLFMCESEEKLNVHRENCHVVRCPYMGCNKIFRSERAQRHLSEHIKVVHEGKLYFCGYCGESLKWSSYYRAHVNKNQSCAKGKLVEEQPLFYCSCCGKSLKERKAIDRHRKKKSFCSAGVIVTTKPASKKCREATPDPSPPVSPVKTGVKRSSDQADGDAKRARYVIPKKASSTVTSGAYELAIKSDTQSVEASSVTPSSVQPTQSNVNISGGSPPNNQSVLLNAVLSLLSTYASSIVVPPQDVAPSAVNPIQDAPKEVSNSEKGPTSSRTDATIIPDETPDEVGRRFSLKITRLENDEKLFLYIKKAGLKVSGKLPSVPTIESPDDSEDELTDDDEADDDVVFKKPALVGRVKTSTPKRILPVNVMDLAPASGRLIVDPQYLEQHLNAIQHTISRMNFRLKKAQEDIKDLKQDLEISKRDARFAKTLASRSIQFGRQVVRQNRLYKAYAQLRDQNQSVVVDAQSYLHNFLYDPSASGSSQYTG